MKLRVPLGRAQRRKKPGEMNKLERRWSEQLDVAKATGTVLAWWYERVTFKLAHDTRYTPDFMVLAHDGVIELHETKGFMRDDAHVKLKLCAELFPFRVKLVEWKGKQWIVKDLTAAYEDGDSNGS
jgi:hypothetical protein